MAEDTRAFGNRDGDEPNLDVRRTQELVLLCGDTVILAAARSGSGVCIATTIGECEPEQPREGAQTLIEAAAVPARHEKRIAGRSMCSCSPDQVRLQ